MGEESEARARAPRPAKECRAASQVGRARCDNGARAVRLETIAAHSEVRSGWMLDTEPLPVGSAARLGPRDLAESSRTPDSDPDRCGAARVRRFQVRGGQHRRGSQESVMRQWHRRSPMTWEQRARDAPRPLRAESKKPIGSRLTGLDRDLVCRPHDAHRAHLLVLVVVPLLGSGHVRSFDLTAASVRLPVPRERSLNVRIGLGAPGSINPSRTTDALLRRATPTSIRCACGHA